MEILLKAKHWQIFIILIIGIFISNFTIENNNTITLILKIIGITLYFLYPFIIGLFLYDYVPNAIRLNHNFFLVNSFIWITTYLVVMVLSDGKGMTFNGLAAIPMFYVAFAFLHYLSFPAKTLKSIEIDKEAKLGDYIGDFFLIVFLPIGIWFLQPRINRILKTKEKIID